MNMHLLIADPRDVYRIGLQTLLSQNPYIASITEVTTIKDLQTKLASNSINFVIAHQSLVPNIFLLPKGRFIILVNTLDKDLLISACQQQACGYFFDHVSIERLQKALQLPPLYCFLDPELTLWAIISSQNAYSLTPREQEIFTLKKDGLSIRAIAQNLTITQTTVKRHLANIRIKGAL